MIFCVSNTGEFLAGLASDVPIRYFLHTEYNGDKITHSDEMWDSIKLDAMLTVAYSSAMAKGSINSHVVDTRLWILVRAFDHPEVSS